MIKIIWWISVFIAFASFGALIVLIGLHEYHYSFDPYSWFHIGGESVLTRDLWNAQKDLYRYLIVRAFILTAVFASVSAILGFLKNRINRNLK